ncbi:hypothetical protein D3C83_292870 [compost metagenome]
MEKFLASREVRGASRGIRRAADVEPQDDELDDAAELLSSVASEQLAKALKLK